MRKMIAIGLCLDNSHRPILAGVAGGYALRMRGEKKRKLRAKRLRQLNERYTYEEMANRLGGNANPRYLSQIANEYLPKGRKTPRGLSDDYASRLEACFGLPPGWFDTPDEAKEESGSYAAGQTSDVIITTRVPLISWTTAGDWAEIVDNFQPGDAEDWIPTTKKISEHSFALRIRGDSMVPTIADDSIVIVDPEAQYHHRSIVIVRQNHDNEATCKRLIQEGSRWFLQPDNPRYPVIALSPDAQIVGVVRQVIIDIE